VKAAAFGLFALFVLIAVGHAQVAFAQDDAASGEAVTSSDSATTGDAATSSDAATSGDATASADAAAPAGDSGADWARVNPDTPASDLSADSAEKVLEIPQTACIENGVAVPCDERLSVNKSAGNGGNSDDSGDDGDTITSSGGGSPASPQTFDDDTASAGPVASDPDWGTVDDYANQQVYGVPYGMAQYGVASRGPIYANPAQIPMSRFPYAPMPMSGPITQAARPPIAPSGPWMTPPSMMSFSRPAGSPMASAFRSH